jgi:hypothetical protein
MILSHIHNTFHSSFPGNVALRDVTGLTLIFRDAAAATVTGVGTQVTEMLLPDPGTLIPKHLSRRPTGF